MAHSPSPTIELLQLLTVLGVGIESHDSLTSLSPSFLESKLQSYLSLAQTKVGAANSKIDIAAVEDLNRIDLKPYQTAPVHEGGHGHGGHGHDHSHSHDGNDHGHDHSHGGHDHGHDGHDHGHDGHDHSHTHDGEPCSGHDSDSDSDSAQSINQVLRALKHYMSILTQGILSAWNRPPMFPGAPRRNIWVLREPNRLPTSTNQGHDLILTIAGGTTLTVETDGEPSQVPVILLNYALETPQALQALFGETMISIHPREILHLLQTMLDANHRRCPSFKAVDDAQVGPASVGFKPSFLVPVSEESPDEANVSSLDIRKDKLDKLATCDICGFLGPDLKCAKCKIRTYCSAACQRNDWKKHKVDCK